MNYVVNRHVGLLVQRVKFEHRVVLDKERLHGNELSEQGVVGGILPIDPTQHVRPSPPLLVLVADYVRGRASP